MATTAIIDAATFAYKNLDEDTVNLIVVQFLQELRRLKIMSLKEKQIKLTTTVLNKIVEGGLNDPRNPGIEYKMLEFSKQNGEWNAIFKCPLLPEWFEDFDYTTLVTKARTNIAGMKNVKTSIHFKKKRWKKYTKDLIHGVIQKWHADLYANTARIKGKEATDELWLIQAPAHTTPCQINSTTIIFEPGLTFKEEVKRYEKDIEDEIVLYRKHMDEMKRVSSTIKENGPSEKLIEEKNNVQEKINESWELISSKKHEIKSIKELINKGVTKSGEELRDTFKFVPGNYANHIKILQDAQQRLYPNQSGAFYGSFVPFPIRFNWDNLVHMSGYYPVPIPYFPHTFGYPTGLIQSDSDEPLLTKMEVGEENITFYTTELIIPLPLEDEFFRRHGKKIKSAQEHREELIAAEAEIAKTKEGVEKSLPAIAVMSKEVLSEARKKESCDKDDKKLPSKPLREVSEFEKYLNECDNNNIYKTRVWSEIVKILNGMETAHKDTMNGRYGGGFATYLYTKGKYDTTDIDYKIYPTTTESEEERKEKMIKIKEQVETYINNNKQNLLDSINGDKKTFTEVLTKWSIGRVTPEEEAAAQGRKEGVFKITLVGPGYGSDGAFYGNTRTAYCDIGFWNEHDVTAEVAIKYGLKNIVDGIAPGVNVNFYNKFQMRVINKDFIIAEKKMFLEDGENNSSIQHKIPSWENQIKLLEELKGGRRTRRTRRKKKKRTKKKKKRTKKKRRKMRKKTRRRK